jgi:hypothetical protein
VSGKSSCYTAALALQKALLAFPVDTVFSLKSSVEAKKAYQKAVIKIRLAIPGSIFELWVVSYDQVYCLSQRTALKIAPQPRFQIGISMRVGVPRCVQTEVMALLTALYWHSKPFYCFCPVKS